MHFRNARPAPSIRLSNARRESNRTRLFSDALESRLLLAITQNVVVGGTLDIFPISSIFPSGPYTAMEVQATTVPHTQYGNMYRTDGISEFIWGSGAPNAFNPSGTANRIFSGQGFRYKHTGTVAGVQESIPIRFRDSTGFNTLTDTLIINVTSPVGAPQITQQPQGLTSVATGSTATLSVVATGNPTLSYQWFTGLSPNTQFPISGATSSTYTTPPLTPSPIGLDYQYWVRVSNGVGSAASVTATVKVGAVPTANAGGPYNATEGGTVQLTGSGTDPNNGLYLVFEWDLDNDGLYNETGIGAENGNENVQNPIFQAKDGPAAYPVKLRTTNDRGLSTVANGTVNITNVAPSNLTPSVPTSVGQGVAFNVTGTFADPGTLDTHSVTLNWGDGSPDTVLNLAAGVTSFSTTKTYPVSYAPGAINVVTITVTDKDGASVGVQRNIVVTRSNQFTVNTTGDEDNGTADPAFGTGTSLREAIRYAEAKSGADTITFAAGLAGQTLTLANGWNNASDDTALRVVGDLTLDGANVLTLKTSPTGTKRRLFLSTAGTFTLKNLTIADIDVRGVTEGAALWTNGTAVINSVLFLNNKATNGGAIMNFGNVAIAGSSFNSNGANSEGGAIASGGALDIADTLFFQNSAALGGAVNSAGPLTANRVVFSTNTSSFNGGALRLFNTANISGSTFSNNTAVNGGGALISHGNTTLTNSTIANNVALDGGGAQFFEGTALLRHVTLAYNTASRAGGGIAINSANATLTNTIVAGNTGVDQNDVWGTPNAASANNVLNQSAAQAGLGALVNNGGPNATILPLPGSPAINGGVAIAGVTVDQRNVARPQGSAPDIGAVERAATAAAVSSIGFESLTRLAVNFAFTGDASVTFSRANVALTAQPANTPVTSGSLVWDPTGALASLVLTNLLPNGNYRATAGAQTVDFFVLHGDFNRDRSANFDDLLVLAANYNQSGRNNAQGDANYDGTVNFDDLLSLAANYNSSIPAGAPALAAPPPASNLGDDDSDEASNDPASVL